MCVNCNIPMPVKHGRVRSHPKGKCFPVGTGAVMSNHELADIINPPLPGGGLKALVSGDVGDCFFVGGVRKYNYSTLHLHDWIPEGVKVTDDGHIIRIGRIRDRRQEDKVEINNGIDELDRVCGQWYVPLGSLRLLPLSVLTEHQRVVSKDGAHQLHAGREGDPTRVAVGRQVGGGCRAHAQALRLFQGVESDRGRGP